MVSIDRVIGDPDFANTGDFGGCLGDRTAVFASNQQIDVTTDLLRSGNRIQSCYGDFFIVVFDYDQVTHD